MQQLQLFQGEAFASRQIQTNSINAVFVEIKKSCFEVVLEISSNKFLIQIKELAGTIEQFEIIAIKSFIDITQKTIALLKQVTQHLLLRLEN